jgi:apolipoprotein N-acyltransferase
MFVTLTNTGWFQRSAAGQQHLAHAVFRCAENRRPMIRSANNGVTSSIDHLGRVRQIFTDSDGTVFGEGVFFTVIDVPPSPPVTFYMRYGDVFSLLCLGVTLGAAAAALFRRP